MDYQETRKKQYKKITAELTIDFFNQVDTRAHALKMSKSELVRQALTQFLSGSISD